MTPREISKHLGLSRTSVQRIIEEDLNLRPLKKMSCQQLSEIDCKKRLERCRKLLKKYTNSVLENAFFSDEKIFKVHQTYNRQNDRVYASKDTKKSEVEEK